MTSIIYSKPNCPFCDRAKRLLDEQNIQYEEKSAIEHRQQLIEKVVESTGQQPRTVPQIWVGGNYVGGYDQLVEYFKKIS